MAIRTKAQYSGLYLTSGGTWPDQASGAISPQDLRNGVQDLYDSVNSNWSSDSSGISIQLSGLYDVSSSPPVDGSMLNFNGTTWAPTTNILANSSGLIISGSANNGFKFNTSAPAFGWKDLTGQIIVRAGGGQAPTLANYRGAGIREYYFSNGDVIDNITFHIPHDYVPGSEMYIHTHWGHNETTISGNFVIDYYLQYCKGYNQASQTFNSAINLTQTISGINSVTTHPRYGHFIDELQFTTPGGAADKIDTSLIEVDGLLLVGFTTTSIPATMTGGAGGPFIFMIDIHYQTNGLIGTPNKNYPFYT